MLTDAYDFLKLSYLWTAINAVCGSVEDKKNFTTYALEMNRLMRYTACNDIINGQTRKKFEAIVAV